MAQNSIKKRIFSMLEDGSAGNRAARLFDRILIALIIINLISAVCDTVPELHDAFGRAFLAIEVFTLTIFALEYLLRLWVADLHLTLRRFGPWRARLRYMVQPAAIIDLAVVAPGFVSLFIPGLPAAGLVVFRLLRFFKLARYSPGMRSLTNAIASERRALMASAVILIGLIIIAASLLHAVEGSVQPEAFGSMPAAIYWAVSTVTTVGYGDFVPVTPVGKTIAGFAMLLGFWLFALPAGIIATAFSRDIHQRDFVVTWGMLARVPLFAELNAGEIATIMPLLHAQTVEKDTIITKAGDPAHSMYFIVSGSVEIVLPHQSTQLSDGDFFGEIAILHNARRSATATALSRTKLLVLDAGDFNNLMAKHPNLKKHVSETAKKRLAEHTLTPRGDIVSDEIGTPKEP